MSNLCRKTDAHLGRGRFVTVFAVGTRVAKLGRTMTSPDTPDVVAAAMELDERLAALDRHLRRDRVTIPPAAAYDEVTAVFWTLVATLRRAEAIGVSEREIARCREIVGRWLFRARVFNRAYHKPHGYAGDFMMVEWMYDLERDSCALSHQPAVVNCLDHLGKSVHSIVAVWERRHHYAALLRAEHERRDGRLRVLDVAAGGGRYLRDFLEQVRPGADLSITVLDQDSAAIAFCRTQSLAAWPDQVRLVDAPIRDLPRVLGAGEFDVIISAGLFDYLDDTSARRLLAELADRLAPGGTLAISNFHPDDSSRLVKAWLVDWPLVYRDEPACAQLFPSGLAPATSRSADRSLVYARAVRPGGRA